ncbi:hypothetical protein [Actinoplanes sp. ATCC 53533]|uniref:hypothetical protein n=1 Tax=Actinoplanes sp. ATCC 53533 TaxID=1288362 RepID=UPI000F798E35|nr:hypothetical protein [Actinoplanes sp. ATCC 53533]
MLRSCKYVAAWMAAAALAVTVSWFGVRVGLAPALTAEAPVAIDVNRRYTEVHLGVAEVTPPPSSSPGSKQPKPSRSVSARAKPTATKRAKPKVSASPSARPSASAPAVPEEQEEYEISADGGTAIVAFSATRVDALDADPIAGYVASYTRRSDTLIVIRLDGPSHSSVITAYWLDGPHARIAEEFEG